jgi:hypothetical protein
MKMELEIHPNTPQDFGPILKGLRSRAGVTQRELASASQISERHLRRVESGEFVPGAWMQFNPPSQLGRIMADRFEAERAHTV